MDILRKIMFLIQTVMKTRLCCKIVTSDTGILKFTILEKPSSSLLHSQCPGVKLRSLYLHAYSCFIIKDYALGQKYLRMGIVISLVGRVVHLHFKLNYSAPEKSIV